MANLRTDWRLEPGGWQEAEAVCAGRADAVQLQMAIFEAVVQEFSPASATAMQLPWDFHNKCRASFQVGSHPFSYTDSIDPSYKNTRYHCSTDCGHVLTACIRLIMLRLLLRLMLVMMIVQGSTETHITAAFTANACLLAARRQTSCSTCLYWG